MNKRLLSVILTCLIIGAVSAGAQPASPLEDAKALYDSASFEEALAVLDNLGRTQPETDVEEVQRYRALCLLALNRAPEAQSAIEIVFSRNPMYKLSEGDAPPRMQAAFKEVRRRLLPKVTEQLYASAKLSFDRKEYEVAATQFQNLLTFLEDADAKSLPSLKEFRTLATGFHDLSASAPVAAAKPGSSSPAPTPASASAPTSAPASPAVAGPVQPAASQTAPASTLASEGSTGVLQAPVPVKQQMPLWYGPKNAVSRPYNGKLRIIIDERGNVEEARIVESVNSIYDSLLISAARTWKYEPAKMDGKPVRYAKMIDIVIKPTP
jgi:TonB family protein